jgi:hypothetical protein
LLRRLAAGQRHQGDGGTEGGELHLHLSSFSRWGNHHGLAASVGSAGAMGICSSREVGDLICGKGRNLGVEFRYRTSTRSTGLLLRDCRFLQSQATCLDADLDQYLASEIAVAARAPLAGA